MELPAENIKSVFLLTVSLLWLVFKAHGVEVFYPDRFKAVQQGNTVTLTCWLDSTERNRVWYQLTPNRRLQLVASTDTLYSQTTFKKQPHHYVVTSEHSRSHLRITSTTLEDAGTYYCGVMKLRDIEFGLGMVLIIKGPNPLANSVIQQPEHESVHSGASVNLSCSVPADHCAAEQTSIMWLKRSNQSDLEVIYSFRDMNSTCQRTGPGSREPACVHTFVMRNLRSADAGTYYCAVNICGRMLFGNGTGINVYSIAFTESTDLRAAVIALMLSNTGIGIVTLLLAWILCKNKKSAAASEPSEGVNGNNQSDVFYATVRAASRKASRQVAVKPNEHSTIYSEVYH